MYKQDEVTLIVDADRYAYNAAAAGEKRSILVKHELLGEMKFPNRTAFWGRGKTIGGALAELNKDREVPYEKSEFTITDVQESEEVSHTLHTAKAMINKLLQQFNTTKYKLYLGRGDCFRVEMSTLLKYKGQRDDLLRPLALDAVKDYYLNKFNSELCTFYEADDAVVMAAWKKKDHIVVAGDKDIFGTGIICYNYDMPNVGVIDTNCFGKLWIDAKGKVRGHGRIWLYFQVLSEDDSDNYCANCFSDTKWGPMSAYKALLPCTTDVAAFKVLVDCFKMLYPEKKTVEGWRGNQIEIDAIYVLNECWQMARMRRFEGDEFHITSVLDKNKINY